MEKNIINLIIDADSKLNLARKEMFKAEENVVTHLVCQNSRESLRNYLSAFLMLKKIKFSPSESIPGLLKKCGQENKTFQKIDLTTLDCRYELEEERFCFAVNKAGYCLDTVEAAKQIFKEVTKTTDKIIQ